MINEKNSVVDPSGIYGMTDEQKKFVLLYLNYRDIVLVGNLLGIDKNKAKSYFTEYGVQQEIWRLNQMLIEKQCESKMLTLADLGGWLSSIMTEKGLPVAVAAKISIKDKLKAAELIMALNEKMNTAMSDPSEIIYAEVEKKFDTLSIAELQDLVKGKKPDEEKAIADEKETLIESLPGHDNLTGDDISYLRTLSMNELREFKKQVEDTYEELEQAA